MKYLSFYRKEMQKVRDGLKTAGPAMPVFLESRVGLSDACCETIAHGMLADLLTAAGGQNLATPLIPGTAGTLSVEWLLQTQPAVYIATGVGNPKTLNQPGSRKIALGQGIRPGDAQASLQRALQRPGLAQLNAVRTGRAHALSHHFGYSAANVAAVQALAKWLHPQAFATLDPQATLQRFYQDFQPVPLTGTFWVTE